MSEKRYIHIRNWDGFQHPDVTRNRRTAVPWIKDATAQLSDEDYVGLSYADRGLLQSLRLQYALNRGAGIDQDTSNLLRLLGQRVTRAQLERLNHAGFILVSASKAASNMQATLREKTRLDVETEREVETEKNKEQTPTQTQPVTRPVAENGSGQGRENEQDLQPLEQILPEVLRSIA